MSKRKKNKKDSSREMVVQDAERNLAEIERQRKRALLELQLAKLDAGEDVDPDELGDGGGSNMLATPQGAESALGMLGQIGQVMNGMGVEDVTAGDAEGGPGIPFTRHAGSVRNVKVDRHGRVQEIDFQPEEWPPRNEKF